jgi:two-component system CheB/CheR fusion protein
MGALTVKLIRVVHAYVPGRVTIESDTHLVNEFAQYGKRCCCTLKEAPSVNHVDLFIQSRSGGSGISAAVVGIGASAGGLEALEELFRNMPADTGMAFIVVTHLPPGHRSLLPELLSKVTDLPVLAAATGLEVKADHIYVSPPGGQLSIQGGRLQRLEQDPDHAPKMPINYFLRSLARDLCERAVCIILSGTGSDGTLGLQEIKAQAGMVMAEDPQSAKYSGMPTSALATGLVD